MSTTYHAIRHPAHRDTLQKGDVLVLFGELFNRGYANGLVEAAEKRGMTVIRSTVGRREKDGTLRALNADEIASVPQPFVNVPLEAGFDLEPAANGLTPVDQLKDVKLSDWESTELNHEALQQSLKSGQARFRQAVRTWVQQVIPLIPKGANVVFAHLMAGGVPRAKIVMPLMNRTFKGHGDRYLASEKFWQSSIGQLCAMSFNEVTANTLDILIHETTELRQHFEATNSKISYLAYGYHGTEVLLGQNFVWQTYTPYLQGWAKMKLEGHAQNWRDKKVAVCVYNCPEILTNSSSIFQGVEVSLYPLLGALQKEAGASANAARVLAECQDLLKSGVSLSDLQKYTDTYLQTPLIRQHCDFGKWPQHTNQAQLELMLNSSDHLIDQHQDPKKLITAVLSEVVFAACGEVMLLDCPNPEAPVSWLNHDVVARTFGQMT